MLIAPLFFARKRVEFSFSTDSRLLTAADFGEVFQNSCCKAGDNAFFLLAGKNKNEQARLGLAIAKKQLRRAVDRNRVKRMAREAFRHQQRMLEGLDIVVLCRSGAVGLNKVQIRRKLEQLFDKIAHHNDR